MEIMGIGSAIHEKHTKVLVNHQMWRDNINELEAMLKDEDLEVE